MLESVPAVRQLETTRPDLMAVEIVGHVSSADAENLYGLLQAAYALHPRIDVLVRMVDYDGADWNEISEETLNGGKVLAREHVGRCAAVGDPDWTVDVQGWFTSVEPIELRHFSDEAEAWAWLGATQVEEEV